MNAAQCIDYETTGLDSYNGAKWFSYSLSDALTGDTEVFYGRTPKHMRILKDFWRDPSTEKVAHNMKFELSITAADGIEVPRGIILHDTMIQAQLIDNSMLGYGLDKLTVDLCNYPTEQDEEINRWARMTGRRYDKIPKDVMVEYQKHDGMRTALLHSLFMPMLESNPALHSDYRNEMELIRATRRMESFGVMIDRKQISKMVDSYEIEVNQIQHDLGSTYGEFMNLNSNKVVSTLLYETLKLPIMSYTEKGTPSIDKDALFKLLDECPMNASQKQAIHLILKQRAYTKGIAMLGGYATAAGADDIIHPSVRTNAARTGRESCASPNLQNVSKEAALKTMYPIPARKAFRSRQGAVMLFVDYAGIEMRLIIDAGNQVEMMQGLMRGGHGLDDPHIMAATTFFGTRFTDPEEALAWWLSTDDKIRVKYSEECRLHGHKKAKEEYGKKAQKVLRTGAKNGQFGIAYGAGQSTVEHALNMRAGELTAGFRAYCERFPEVANFTRNTIAEVRKTGGVTTAFGRFLKVERNKPYAGANYKIQGTAAGILKRAQVRVDEYIQDTLLDEMRLILPIHDELVFHYPRNLLTRRNEILGHISQLMTSMDEIKVPLEVEWKMSTYSWDKAKEFSLDKAK